MESYLLQKLTELDIPDLVELSTLLGWDYSAEEMTTVLKAGLVYGHKDEAGKTVSSSAIFPYGEELASLGVVMVHPDHRRRGLGKEAVVRCMKELASVPTMLVATSEGVPLYEGVGYKTVGTLHKFLCDQYRAEHAPPLAEGYEILPLSSEDLEAVVQLDQLALGGQRRPFLQTRISQAKEGILLKQGNEIVGYGLSIQGPVYLVIGSIVAPDAAAAMNMVHHLAQNHDGKLRIDVPSEHHHLHGELEARGFTLVNQPPIMLANSDRLPPRNGTLFAISSQAFG